jgi:transcriptional regulator with XRE-family HTH domain
MDSIGKIIKEYHKKSGKKGFEIAKEAGISAVYLTHIENYNRLPTVDIIKRLEKVLNTPPLLGLYINAKIKEILDISDDFLTSYFEQIAEGGKEDELNAANETFKLLGLLFDKVAEKFKTAFPKVPENDITKKEIKKITEALNGLHSNILDSGQAISVSCGTIAFNVKYPKEKKKD